MNAWAALETPLDAPPRFFVEPRDGRKDWSEDKRLETFFAQLHWRAPSVMAHHVKNEGRYNHALAKRRGVVAGVFDVAVYGEAPLCAVIELKGYTSAGRAGALSQAQIDWGNAMFDRGWHVACFFDPHAAIEWLRGLGFAVRGRVTA